jgi:biopolymer transport protein ExbD
VEAPSRVIQDRLFYYRRRFHATHRSLRGLLAVAPWVDVVLLVLMFFVVNASFVIQPGVSLNLPAAELPGGARFGDLVVTIPQEGMFFFNDERMTLDGLAAALAREARARPDATLMVEADGRIAHQTLVRVYGMAHQAGLRDVVLATRQPSPP